MTANEKIETLYVVCCGLMDEYREKVDNGVVKDVPVEARIDLHNHYSPHQT